MGLLYLFITDVYNLGSCIIHTQIRLRVGRSEIQIPANAKIFLFSKLTQPPIQWVPEILKGLKRPQFKAIHLYQYKVQQH
jgi:hypothetical protein